MALKELNIRSEFRTTVEYLIMLFETDDFKNNLFHTGWLDLLIKTKKQVGGEEDGVLYAGVEFMDGLLCDVSVFKFDSFGGLSYASFSSFSFSTLSLSPPPPLFLPLLLLLSLFFSSNILSIRNILS